MLPRPRAASPSGPRRSGSGRTARAHRRAPDGPRANCAAIAAPVWCPNTWQRSMPRLSRNSATPSASAPIVILPSTGSLSPMPGVSGASRRKSVRQRQHQVFVHFRRARRLVQQHEHGPAAPCRRGGSGPGRTRPPRSRATPSPPPPRTGAGPFASGDLAGRCHPGVNPVRPAASRVRRCSSPGGAPCSRCRKLPALGRGPRWSRWATSSKQALSARS